MLRENDLSSLKQQMIWSAVLHIALFSYGIIYSFLPKPKHPILVAVEIAGEGELRKILDANSDQQKRIEQILRQQSEKENPQDKNAQESKPEDKIEENKADKNPNETPIPREKSKKKPSKKKEASKKKVQKKSQRTMKDAIKKVSAQKKWRSKLNEIAKKSEEEIKKKEELQKIEDAKNAAANSFGGGSGFGSVSAGEAESVSAQIYPHWAVPSGIKDAENFVIEIRVKLKDNGEVIPADIEILDKNRYANDYIFRAAADSARRAILEASPLTIPRDKIDLFREFIFRFNVKEALGG